MLADWLVGFLWLVKGDLDPAIRHLEHGVMLARTTGTRNMFGAAGHLLAMGYALAGRVAEAVTLYEEASDALSQLVVARSWILAGLAEVWLLAGRAAEVRTLAHTAFDLSETQREGVWAVRAMQVLGHVYAHGESPDVAAAEDWYHRALIRANELSARPFVGHSHLGLGTLYAKTGKRELAVEHLAAAAALYREMEMTFWVDRADARLRSPG
jgi:tetratricopeptide (TPR) repeat protein